MNKIRPLSKIFILLTLMMAVTTCTQSPQPQADKLKISYEKYVMPNGLQVILHADHSDPMISYAIMYHVGSSREIPG